MKTSLIPLLTLALAASTALADSHGQGRDDARRGERRERRMEHREHRGGQGRWEGRQQPGGPMSDEMREQMRAEYRAIKELADAARAETDETRKAELADQLRTKLGEVADRIQAHREERLAQAEARLANLQEQIAHARENRDELIEENLERILAGERPVRPAAYDRFPQARGGRGPGDATKPKGPCCAGKPSAAE